MSAKRKIWNYELCRKEAKKYTTRYAFKQACGSAYQFAIKNNFLDDICSHMHYAYAQMTTFEDCKHDSKNYKNIGEYQIKNQRSYWHAKKNNWLYRLFPNSILPKRNRNVNDSIKEVKKYKTKYELYLADRGLYDFLYKNGILNKACAHMPKRNAIQRELLLQNSLEKQLRMKYPHLIIKREYRIPKRDNKNGYIDFFIKNPLKKNFILLEIKHSDSKWSQRQIKTQVSKYNRAFRERIGYHGCYVVSDTGKYGISIKNINDIISIVA